MTIACCYVSPEGVVFGADSTTSYGLTDGPHYFNHAQKIFEVGDDSTLAVMFWGLAGLGEVSLRTIAALLDDDLKVDPAVSLADIAARWGQLILDHYQAQYGNTPEVIRASTLYNMGPTHNDPIAPNHRNQQEDEELLDLQLKLTLGTCIGGRMPGERTPLAYFMHVLPYMPVPQPTAIPVNSYQFWGAPNMLERLIFAADQKTRADILASGHWNGTAQQLDDVLATNALHHPILPLREVVDFVHTCVQSTIKALKFSHFQQICGGPIELAVVSTDRKFRWVRHKEWSAAVMDGGLK